MGGNVGIGNTQPEFPLDIIGPQNVALRVTGGNSANNEAQCRFRGAKSNADLWAVGPDVANGNGSTDFFFYDILWGQAPFMIQSITGNVGIGVQSPTSKLSVAGNVQLEGIVYGDGSVQRTAQVEGPAGPRGPQGPQGPPGAPGICDCSDFGSSQVFLGLQEIVRELQDTVRGQVKTIAALNAKVEGLVQGHR